MPGRNLLAGRGRNLLAPPSDQVSPALSGAPRKPIPTFQGGSAEQYLKFLEDMRNYSDSKGRGTTSGEWQDFFAGIGKAATDIGLGAKQVAGLASFEDAADKRALDAPLMATPAGRAGQVAGNIGTTLPAAFVPGVNTAVGGAIMGGAIGALQPTERAGDRAVNTAVGAVVGGGVNAAANRIAARLAARQSPQAPTIDEIKMAKDAAYAAADASNDIVPLDQIGRVVPKVETMLRDEGYRPALHPATSDALASLYEESTRPGVYGQTMKGVEGLRRQLMQAELSATNAGDARMAGKVLDQFDDFMDTIPSTAQYRTARELYARLRKAQDIEALFEKARNAAGGYTQSGFENTLRIQFRQLADNPKRFNRFNSEEKAAILRVVRGGPVQSIARFLGKFAARGPVSSMATGIVGGAIGGPGGAAVLGAGGELAKGVATQMRTNAANTASEVVRRGATGAVASRVPIDQLGFLPPAAANAVIGPSVEFLDWLRGQKEVASR